MTGDPLEWCNGEPEGWHKTWLMTLVWVQLRLMSIVRWLASHRRTTRFAGNPFGLLYCESRYRYAMGKQRSLYFPSQSQQAPQSVRSGRPVEFITRTRASRKPLWFHPQSPTPSRPCRLDPGWPNFDRKIRWDVSDHGQAKLIRVSLSARSRGEGTGGEWGNGGFIWRRRAIS